ncbi:hypothetical protein SAMN05216388_1017121 [Halorientalis persicus]|uniref:Uncharacterized protein n=1 Tax=Halorientalis persicus TaxID=1367881 RepID=A0A1H8S2X2_9EURY|nr:hypothetical protein [Halorientalis persicus]SEO72774.1 hypothetical protein SAMN05216388_1017121 [Halorientalis persicus]
MPGTLQIVADGSAVGDARRVEIDRGDEPMRWRCPNGHVSWDRTNNHLWCPSCRRQAEAGDDVEPEHWELVDAKTDRTIPYSAVRFAGEQ